MLIKVDYADGAMAIASDVPSERTAHTVARWLLPLVSGGDVEPVELDPEERAAAIAEITTLLGDTDRKARLELGEDSWILCLWARAGLQHNLPPALAVSSALNGTTPPLLDCRSCRRALSWPKRAR